MRSLRRLVECPIQRSWAGSGTRPVLSIALAVALLAGCGSATRSTSGRQEAPPNPPPHRLISELASAARGIPVRGVTQITHDTSTGVWSLDADKAGPWICFALEVPREEIGESNCTRRSQVAKEQLLIYPGAEPPTTGKRPVGYAVYGTTSATVKSVSLKLSDCTRMQVPVDKRPFFWAFVAAPKVAEGIVPVAVIARTDSRIISGPLTTLGPRPRGSCSPGR